MSHMVQADDSLCMVGVTTFFPFLVIFLVVVIGFTMGISLAGVVSTAIWVGLGSSGPGGFNPNAVTLVAGVPGGGERGTTLGMPMICWVIPVLPKPARRGRSLGGREKWCRLERLSWPMP